VRRPKRQIELYLVGVLASLTLATLGGFPLGIIAALGGARDIGLGERWSPLVQAHGHLQIIGWVGLFIAGIAFHVLPRFKNTDLKLRALALPSLTLLAMAAVLRTAAQPWSDSTPVDFLLVASGVLDFVGACSFAAIIAAMLLPKTRKDYDWYLLAACVWFVGASLANLVVLTELALDGNTVLASAKTAPLLEMYLLGFITLFILGVSTRVLPNFLSLRTSSLAALIPALVTFNAALALRVGSGWIAAYSSWSRPDWIGVATAYGIAASVVAFILTLNLHVPSQRDGAARGFRGHERLIRAAYMWLVLAVAIEAWFATRSLVGDFAPDFLEAGAARHALALGFVTQIMFGVGYRVLPVFSGKPLRSERLVDATLVLLNMAVIVRVGHAVVPEGSAAFRFDHIAAAGGIAMLALLIFAFNILMTILGRSAMRSPAPESLTRGPSVRDDNRLAITQDTIVADVIEQVPGSLELLISYGLTPLADPEIRARAAPNATLGTACERHGIDLQMLIRELEQLARS
jgi:uncharacterized protein involved in response to NO